MPADLDRLGTAARAHGLPLIEDAAQALGAEYHGRKAGSWGTVGCFSFFPAKPLGALGDGGMIVTSDETLFLRCRQLRVHGAAGKHTHHAIGGNFRLDALQAAVLRAKLPHLQGWLRARRQHAAAYDAAFATLTGLVRPPRRADCEGSFSHYTVRVRAGRRNALAEHLRARGVASAVHYPRPLHLQPALAHLRIAAGSLPESERAAREVLSLPLYPELSLEQRKHVIAAVREFFG
jgi:dTDP-4-amino-4,6-dideoxygalactose transaminase